MEQRSSSPLEEKDFVHLHLHTHYSLLDGLSKIDPLLDHVKKSGMHTVAVTDHGNMYGAIEFYKKAKKKGIKPILGCEVYVASRSMHDKSPDKDNRRYHLILLAKNNTGYRNLIKLVTKAHLEGFYYKPRIDKNLLRQHSEGLIGLSACLGGEVSRHLGNSQYEKAKRVALEYQDIFGRGDYFLEIQHHPHLEDQNRVTPLLLKLHRDTAIPIVMTSDAHYIRPEDAEPHDILLAVQTNNKMDDRDRLTMRQDDFSIFPPHKAFEKFSSIPGITQEELHSGLANTVLIAKCCNVNITLGETKLPSFPLPPNFRTPEAYLKYLCREGIRERFPNASPEENAHFFERLRYELSIINKMGFASYFLIVQDFVNWAKKNGIVVGPGRGSAAGSLVAYLLNITNIDPLKYNLIFERFLNPARISMPDIDIDFTDTRRDEVLAYVAQKYGKENVAQIITFGKMASRGAIRDSGRALGLSYDLCDRIAKMIPMKLTLSQALKQVDELKQEYHTNTEIKRLIDAAMKLEGVARHASTHACGVVISEKPLVTHAPLQRSTNDENAVVTQYEMHTIEDLGLLKMDFLGLTNLTIIEEALRLIEKHHGTKINIDDIPLDDSSTFKLLQKAQVTGIFQLEKGMRRFLKDLQPTELEDIIAMVSLYRPGPMGLIPEYIDRKHGRKKVTYLHPKLEPILKNTYGIMVYQEQLLAAVRELAGFSLGEADILRKAVGKKIKKLLTQQEAKFMQGADRVGTPKEIARKFWNLVGPFADYAFNRSHAACYALIAYQTAYLKAHYPFEFMAALLNAHAGDVEKIAFIIDEAQKMKIDVLPPSINHSEETFAITASDDHTRHIRFGLSAIKNVGGNIIHVIQKEREVNGPYVSVENFISRIQDKDLNKKSLESLIKCGAMDGLGERGMLLANVDQLLRFSREQKKSANSRQASLFGNGSISFLPAIRLQNSDPASRWDRLKWEKELLGLYITDHPLKDYQKQLRLQYGCSPIQEIIDHRRAGIPVKTGGLITKVQKIITRTGKPMVFSLLEDLNAKIEVIVFPNLLEQNPEPWQEDKIVVVKGKMNEKDGVAKLICDQVITIPLV